MAIIDKKTEALCNLLDTDGEDSSVDLGAEFYDKELADEMQSIAAMLEISEEEGLQVEVVWSFAREVKTSTIPQACASALAEWDI